MCHGATYPLKMKQIILKGNPFGSLMSIACFLYD